MQLVSYTHTHREREREWGLHCVAVFYCLHILYSFVRIVDPRTDVNGVPLFQCVNVGSMSCWETWLAIKRRVCVDEFVSDSERETENLEMSNHGFVSEREGGG